jgi:hypothetical protein
MAMSQTRKCWTSHPTRECRSEGPPDRADRRGWVCPVRDARDYPRVRQVGCANTTACVYPPKAERVKLTGWARRVAGLLDDRETSRTRRMRAPGPVVMSPPRPAPSEGAIGFGSCGRERRVRGCCMSAVRTRGLVRVVLVAGTSIPWSADRSRLRCRDRPTVQRRRAGGPCQRMPKSGTPLRRRRSVR